LGRLNSRGLCHAGGSSNAGAVPTISIRIVNSGSIEGAIGRVRSGNLDETGVLIGGERFWLWRAVDDEGEVSIFWSNDNVTRTRL
jgi:hypothetical protein